MSGAIAALVALAKDPDQFASPDAALAERLRALLGEVHDEAVARSRYWQSEGDALLGDASRAVRPTAELVVDGVDDETLWQQLQGRSRVVERHARATQVWLAQQREEEQAEEEDDEDDEEEEEDEEEEDVADAEDEEAEEEEEDDFEEEEEEEAEEEEPEVKPKEKKAKKKRAAEPAGGVTEDDFFSLAAMEAFVKEDEDMIARGPEEPVGSDDDDDDDDEEDDEDEDDDDDEEEEDGEMYGQDAKYDDFFDEEDDYSGVDEEEAAEEEAEAEPSRHAASAEKERAHIEELERANLEGPEERTWELRGEVGAAERPRNSLLGVDATWDGRKGSSAPPVDAAFSAMIEDAIRERILEERFDDIVAREVLESAYAEKDAKARARAAADGLGDDDGELGVKSNVGLGEEYERDYVARREAEAGEGGDAAAASRAPKRDDALDALWARLSRKLDALSHFVAAPDVPALDVVGAAKKAGQAAISFEEATPGAGAGGGGDAAAPEEVYGKKRGRDGLLRSAAEATQEERRAARGAKKKARNAKRKRLMADAKVVARVDPGLGNPYEKAKLRAQLEKPVGPEPDKDARGSAYGKSSKFFEQLQRDVHAAVHGSEKDVGAAPGGAKKKQKRAPKKANAAKL